MRNLNFINLNLGLFLIKRAFLAVLFLLMVITAFTVITSRTSLFFGIKSYTVLTGSMSPTIPTGSVIYTIPATQYTIGDVVTFENKGVNITHRIIALVDENNKPVSDLISPISGLGKSDNFSFKTQGDANNKPDSFDVTKENVTGKVIGHIPSIGIFINQLRTFQGLLLAVILPALVFIGFELWNIKKEIERETEKKVMERLRSV